MALAKRGHDPRFFGGNAPILEGSEGDSGYPPLVA